MSIRTRLNDRVLHLTFADPSSRNSFSLRAARDLISAIEACQGEFDALTFRAPGRIFCSGGNLADYAQMTSADEGIEVNRELAKTLREIAELPLPTFALVEGDVFGGGVEFLTAFDFVYSLPHVYFALWQRRVGLTFGWGGGERLERRLGPSRVRQLSLTAQTVSAAEARDLGLVDKICLYRNLDQAFLETWAEMRTLSRAPLASLKRGSSSDEQRAFEGLWWNEEHREALAKFKSRK